MLLARRITSRRVAARTLSTLPEMRPICAKGAEPTLRVAPALRDFVEDEVLPGTGISPATFWLGLDDIVAKFGSRNAALLMKRDSLQAAIDEWRFQQALPQLDERC